MQIKDEAKGKSRQLCKSSSSRVNTTAGRTPVIKAQLNTTYALGYVNETALRLKLGICGYILLVRTLDSLSALLFDYLTFLYVSLGLACRGVWIHLLHADSSSATTAI